MKALFVLNDPPYGTERLVVLALTWASSPGVGAGKDKPSADDIAAICTNVAKVCIATCQEKNYGSVSDAINGV